MLGSKKKEEICPVNEALLNVITPMGLEIKRNSLVIGENLGKVYHAALFLMASHPTLFEKMERYLCPEGIDFAKMMRKEEFD